MKYILKQMTEFMNKDYKQMTYQVDRKIEVLLDGNFRGYKFYILNLGTHPTAYIEIPRHSKLYGKEYDSIYDMGLDLNVNGGLTYSSNKLYLEDSKVINGWFIGWDYAHCYDFEGYELKLPKELRSNGKKWTTEEIFNEVCCAIDEIIEFESNIKENTKLNIEVEDSKIIISKEIDVDYVQALNEIREYIYKNSIPIDLLSEPLKHTLDFEGDINEILQIIAKALGSESNE